MSSDLEYGRKKTINYDNEEENGERFYLCVYSKGTPNESFKTAKGEGARRLLCIYSNTVIGMESLGIKFYLLT